MIGKIQDYKLKEVKVKKDEATVTFTSLSVSFHGAEAAVRTLLMSPYGINIDKLKFLSKLSEPVKGIQNNSLSISLNCVKSPLKFSH